MAETAIKEACSHDNPALVALDRLQASVRERNVDLERWERENAAERDAAARRRHPCAASGRGKVSGEGI